MKKILFYCQYLAGMGHLVRSTEIIRSLLTEFQVCLVNGGQPVDGFEMPLGATVVHLPPILEVAGELQAVDPTQRLEAVQEARKQQLLAVFNRFQPDAVIIECFPFSKHKLKFELIPLLEQIQTASRPIKVVCSLRDLIMTQTQSAEARNQRAEKICDLINRYFDLVLVHADPQLVTLEEQFPRVSQLNCDVYYTGYVSQPLSTSSRMSSEPHQEIFNLVVSAGGGRFGYELLDAVLKASQLLEPDLPHQIQMFTGPFMPAAQIAALQAQASPSAAVRCFTPNLVEVMEQADLSISLGGYNTTMNILRTGVRALVFPEASVEQAGEQTIRAEKLAKKGVLEVLHRSDLQPERLAERIRMALNQPFSPYRVDLQGAARSLGCLRELLEQSAVAA